MYRDYIKQTMVNRGRPKNAGNKVQEINYSNFQKVQDMKLDGYSIRISVKEPTRYFFECWLKNRVGCDSLSHLDNGQIAFPNTESKETREVLSFLLQVCPSAKLVKEPKTKVWCLQV